MGRRACEDGGVERRPDPEPLEVDDVALVAAGSVAWTVGLVVLLVLEATRGVPDWWWQMCAAGAALGLLGVRYCRNRKKALAARGSLQQDL